SYWAILGANFMLFFAFYLIMPILPFYLKEIFNTPNSLIGVILACYTVAALTIRPFAGYLLDAMARKPLYIATFFFFVLFFGGYIVSISLFMVIIVRALQGVMFGIVTVAGNTVVIDIMPSERRGEGLGYYGLANNIAMAFGPMVGLFLHDYFSFNTIFFIAITTGTIGLILASLVHTKQKAPVKRPPISLDRFLLIKGIPAGIALLMLSVPYGITSSYIAVYAQELNLSISSGLFFTFMASGMMASRIFSGKLVDKGYVAQVISVGIIIVLICYFGLALCLPISLHYPSLLSSIFCLIALFVGVGFGTIFPAYNTLFVNLAEHNQRGTANSTYLTSWDIGIGFGLVIGGIVSQHTSFAYAYLIGGTLCLISAIYFTLYVGPHFNRHKLR
ncbi:MAG: MFS transporter, partial [Paludibacteraceae bacterium]|nr:MFS transporter [Paludibacteraceae bacterium]